MNKNIAVIIRTFNNENIIEKTLEAILSQENVNIFIYAIDSNSTDNTIKILDKYQIKTFCIGDMKYHPGKVLNKYLELIQEDLLVFVNSDTVLLSPFSLQILVEDMDRTFVVASYGRQIARPDAWPEVKRDYLKSFPENVENSPKWITLSLPIACIKKSEWLKQSFYTLSWGSEDTEWGKNILKNGKEILYKPKAIAMHSHNYNLSQMCNRAFVEGEADVFINSEERKKVFLFELLRKIRRDVMACIVVYQFFRTFSVIYRCILYQYHFEKGKLSAITRIKTNETNVIFKNYQ